MTIESSGAIQPPVSVARTLGAAAEAAREALDAEACAAFAVEGGALVLRAGGLAVEGAAGVRVEIGEGIAGTAASRGTHVIGSLPPAGGEFRVLAEMGEERFLSALAAPVAEGGELLGVVALYSASPERFTERDGRLLAAMARVAGDSIRNLVFQQNIFRGYRRLASLNLIDQRLDSAASLDDLKSIIPGVCCEHIAVSGCVLRLYEPETRELRAVGSHGVDVWALEKPAPEWKQITEGVVLNGATRVIGGGEMPELPASDGRAFKSAMVTPLVATGGTVGALELFDRLSDSRDTLPFSEGDVDFISQIATHVAHAIEDKRLLKDARKLAFENELRLRELSLLFEITTILRSSLDLEEILYMILTCVTIGEGLGFNRALLFLMDDEREALLGKMGVGPLRPEDARNYWDMVDIAGKSLSEIVREYGRFNMSAGFEVDRLVKETAINVGTDSGVLAGTVRDRKPRRLEGYAPPEDSAEREFFRALNLSSFAVAPLVTKDGVEGAILVDNLVTREPVTRENLTFLMLFANQAASAIEIARAYKDLEMSNKQLTDARDMLVRARTLATLGEFSAGVAHELRNPLVSIGGFARRLIRALPESSDGRNYARIIATEVEGLEQILSQILEFVAGVKPRKKKVDANILVEHVLQLFRESIGKARISVETDLDEAARYLLVDEVQMRQLFINLVKNAVEAMPEGGSLLIRSARMEDEDAGVGFEVKDTGHGIAPDDLDKVFTPFFTRKNKGMGLGLSMCSRIVEGNHEGRMFLDSKRGQGTSVLVWLPSSALLGPDDEPEETE